MKVEDKSMGFYRRPLPETLIAFGSIEGRRMFSEALAEGGMETWFALAEQFHTQADPAYCGLGSLVVVLNALEIDPGRIWKGPWRWYTEEMLDCCLPLERVRAVGIAMSDLGCLARCNGATTQLVRAEASSIEDFRRDVVRCATTTRGPIMIVSYARATLSQTGGGHFSPIGGYHTQRDMVLVLDVARFKYPPHWVALEALWTSMQAVDPTTGHSRGWVIVDKSTVRPSAIFPWSVDGFATTASELIANLTEPRHDTIASIEDLIRMLNDALTQDACTPFSSKENASNLQATEHSGALEILLSELKHTDAFVLVSSTLCTPTQQLRFELITLVLLSFPSELQDMLVEPIHDKLASLQNAINNSPALLAELQIWSEQLTALLLLRKVPVPPKT